MLSLESTWHSDMKVEGCCEVSLLEKVIEDLTWNRETGAVRLLLDNESGEDK